MHPKPVQSGGTPVPDAVPLWGAGGHTDALDFSLGRCTGPASFGRMATRCLRGRVEAFHGGSGGRLRGQPGRQMARGEGGEEAS